MTRTSPPASWTSTAETSSAPIAWPELPCITIKTIGAQDNDTGGGPAGRRASGGEKIVGQLFFTVS